MNVQLPGDSALSAPPTLWGDDSMTELTFGGWVRTASADNPLTAMGRVVAGNGYGMRRDDGKLECFVGSAGALTAFGNGSFPASSCVHAVCRIHDMGANVDVKAYLNGTLAGEGAASGLQHDMSAQFRLGGWAANGSGDFDEVFFARSGCRSRRSGASGRAA